ncbi:MAG TPA: aminopeptidase [Firmicutes bacterium]|nr:aminopeptidase [Bacillota bacterium]
MDDLVEAARIALTDCAGVKKGENVVVVVDEPLREIGKAFWEAARDLGTDAILCEIIPRSTNGEEPPTAVAALLSACDVFMIPTSKSLTHTDARRQACANGARGATLPNIAIDTMKRTLRADYKQIEARTKQVAAAIRGAKEARLTTELGTDITMSLEGRECKEDTGIVTQPGSFTNLPAGEAYLAPVEGTAKGTIVADGSCAGVGVLKQPITIKVVDGFATEITGGEEAKALTELVDRFSKDARNIAELGIGTNDKAILCGSVLEDEKVMGTVHIALGDNISMGGKVSVPSHLDLIIKKPTLIIDGKEIIKDGKLLV